jgi:hypothetical protein
VGATPKNRLCGIAQTPAFSCALCAGYARESVKTKDSMRLVLITEHPGARSLTFPPAFATSDVCLVVDFTYMTYVLASETFLCSGK